MTSPVNLHIVPNCGLTIIPKLCEDDPCNGRARRRRSSLDTMTPLANGVNGKRALSYLLEDIESQGFPVSLPVNKRDFVGSMSPLSPLSLPKQKKKLAGIDQRATRYAFIHPPKGLAAALDWAQIKVLWKQLKYHEKKKCDLVDDVSDTDLNLSPSTESTVQSSFTNGQIGLSARLLRRKNSIDDRQSSPKSVIVPPSSSVLRKWALACFSLHGAFVYFEDTEDGVEVISVNALCLSKLGTNFGLRMAGPYQTPLETIQVLKKLERFEVVPLEHFHE